MTERSSVAPEGTHSHPSVPPEAVVEVTSAVCESLLGAVPGVCAESPSPPERVSGSVSIRGAWRGNVEVRLSPSLADRLAKEVLQLEAGAPNDADVRDVVGEVANMIGGNLKALLPEPCVLSLPDVHDTPRIEHPDLVQTFEIDGERIEVAIARET